MAGSNASLGAFPGWRLYAGSKAVQQAWARVWLSGLRPLDVGGLTMAHWMEGLGLGDDEFVG
jgi:hypothetical protein